MKRLTLTLIFSLFAVLLVFAQSPFSTQLNKNVNLESWQRALGITNGSSVTTNNFYSVLTNALAAGTNITLTFSNNVIYINASTNSSSSGSGITNILLVSTNLIITGSPMSGGGGTFSVDLFFSTNWFTTTNQFQNFTNTAVNTNIYRSGTNLLVTTNTFREFTNSFTNLSSALTNVVMLNPVTQRRWRTYDATTATLSAVYDDLTSVGTYARQDPTATVRLGAQYTSGATSGNEAGIISDFAFLRTTNSIYWSCRFRLNNTNKVNFFTGLSDQTYANIIAGTYGNSLGIGYFEGLGTGQFFTLGKGALSPTVNSSNFASANTNVHTFEIIMFDGGVGTSMKFDGTTIANYGTTAAGQPDPGVNMFFILKSSTTESVAKAVTLDFVYLEYKP